MTRPTPSTLMEILKLILKVCAALVVLRLLGGWPLLILVVSFIFFIIMGVLDLPVGPSAAQSKYQRYKYPFTIAVAYSVLPSEYEWLKPWWAVVIASVVLGIILFHSYSYLQMELGTAMINYSSQREIERRKRLGKPLTVPLFGGNSQGCGYKEKGKM